MVREHAVIVRETAQAVVQQSIAVRERSIRLIATCQATIDQQPT
jgi:hypothetical protein